MSGKLIYIRKCEDCGTAMKGVGPGRRFCDACRRRRDNNRQLRKALRERDDIGALEELPKRAPYKKPTKANSIESVCAREIAAGRTYGQQVEYERRQKELKEHGKID